MFSKSFKYIGSNFFLISSKLRGFILSNCPANSTTVLQIFSLGLAPVSIFNNVVKLTSITGPMCFSGRSN